MSIFFYIVFLIIISIYGVLASSEVGMTLTFLFPGLSNDKSISRYNYKLAWEVVDTFLIFAVIIFVTIFSKTFNNIGPTVLVPLFFAGAGILLRPIIGMYSSHRNYKVNAWTKWLLIITSYLAPLSFACIGIYYFTDKPVLSTIVGITLLLSALIGITIIGLAFVNRNKSAVKSDLKYLLYILFGFWVIGLGFMLPYSLRSFDNTLLRAPLTTLTMILAVSVASFFLYSAMKDKVYELYQYTILIGFTVPVLLGLDLMPYMINGVKTINQANGLGSYWLSILVGFIICLSTIAISFYILYRLFLNYKKFRL